VKELEGERREGNFYLFRFRCFNSSRNHQTINR